MSVRQYFFMQLHSYGHGRQTREQFKRQCKVNEASLPSDNFAGASLNVMKKVLAIKEWSDFEYHVCDRASCPGQGYVWDCIPRSQWTAHKDDVCPHCEGPRFEVVATSGDRNYHAF